MANSQELLNQLLEDTNKAVSRLEEKSPDYLGQMNDLQKKIDQATEIKDEKKRDIRMKVLEAELSKLREAVKQEEVDLAQAVFGLNAMIEQMGAEYDVLQKLSTAEQSLIDSSRRELEAAKELRARAERKWFFRQSAIQKAEAGINTSEQKVSQAEVEAKRLMRQRLLKANMEESLQQFMYRVEKTVEIMEHRVETVVSELQNVASRKQEAFKTKEQAAKAIEVLDQKLNDSEAELKREEDMLDTLINGTPEHSQQTQKVSDLRAKVEDTRGRRNIALILFQSKEKFTAELEIHERSQMKLRDNLKMWITALKSDTEERLVTFRSRLEAMKAVSDQDIAKQLDDVGQEIDQRNAEYMAEVGAASDKLRMDRIEAHPERFAEMIKVQEAQAEAVQKIRIREAKAIEEFKKRYGIDPTKSSFFHYSEEPGKEQ